jgi:hypothetical protein
MIDFPARFTMLGSTNRISLWQAFSSFQGGASEKEALQNSPGNTGHDMAQVIIAIESAE